MKVNNETNEDFHSFERIEHTWTAFFMEPVPLSICLINIFLALGWYDTLTVILVILSPFVVALFHSLYEKLEFGSGRDAKAVN